MVRYLYLLLQPFSNLMKHDPSSHDGKKRRAYRGYEWYKRHSFPLVNLHGFTIPWTCSSGSFASSVMSTVISMDNTVSLCGMPTEVLVRILCSLPDLQTVGSSNLTCRRIHDVCAANTKAITDALISSTECSELAIQYYEVRQQFASRCVNSHLITPLPRLPFQRSTIQRAREILAIAMIGHCAQSKYLKQVTQPTIIDRDFWQSIFYRALILSSLVQRQVLEIGLHEIRVELFRDLDILSLSQISDMFVALWNLSLRRTNRPVDPTWLGYDELQFHDWYESWSCIFCIRSYLCHEHAWYKDWTCGIGEGNFMTRHKPFGKLVKDLVDQGDCVMDIRQDAYAPLLSFPF